MKPRLVKFAVELQPPTAEALRNFAEASGRTVNDVMVAALEVGLGRVMADWNRQKREAAKVAVRVHSARMAARAEAARKAAPPPTPTPPGWWDDDGPTL